MRPRMLHAYSASWIRCSVLLATIYALVLPNAFSQCSASQTQPSPGPWSFPPGTTQYYTFDSSTSNMAANPSGTSPQMQIENAFTAWNAANQQTGNNTTFLPADANHPATITIKADTAAVTASASTSPSTNSAILGAANPATITFHPNAVFPNTSTQAFQPNAAGYNYAYLQSALHEIGHLMGIGDYTPQNPAPQPPNVGVMGPFSGVNDTGNKLTAPTPCDATTAAKDSQVVAGGSGGGGGTGGGGTGPGSCQPPGGTQACMMWNSSTCSYQPICVGGNCCGTSPILIDTDHTGFHLTSKDEGVLFDFFGDGNRIQIAWTEQGSTNGWLALDRNGNGKIDDATELFGNLTPQPTSQTPNGYLALAAYDSNADGVIDKKDAIWPKLLVWIDKNHDGISQPDELFSLDAIGIKQIDLKYSENWYVDQFGNIFRYKGSLKPENGDDLDRITFDIFLNSH